MSTPQSQVLRDAASPSKASEVKVEVESSTESEEKVRSDFQNSLRQDSNEQLPKITIIQVVKGEAAAP